MKEMYKVLASDTLIVLELKVQEALDSGWKCKGGICVVSSIFDNVVTLYFYQAIVKKGK